MKMLKTILYIGNDFAKKSNYNSSMETLSNLLSIEGYNVIKSSNKKNQIIRFLRMCFAVLKYRKKVDYILIDTFSTKAFYFAFFISQLARLFKKKYIPILHGGNLPKRLKKSPKLSKYIFSNSYRNIAPSKYLKEAFEKQGYIVDFIPNTLEIENYTFLKRRQLKPSLLWVRAFAKIYNPTMAIQVLKELKKDFSNVKLCMIGPVKDTTFITVKTLVKELDLENNIEFTGVLPKKEWHKKSKDFDIFINTTDVDNTPVSVIEVMALGLPIISTNVGGLPYLIKNNFDGILVERNNINQMVNAIKKMLLCDNYQLSVNARKKAESFSWKIVKQDWKKILN